MATNIKTRLSTRNTKTWNVPATISMLVFLAQNGHLAHGLPADAVLSDIAKFALEKRFLTRRQADFVKTKIGPYLQYLPANASSVPVFVVEYNKNSKNYISAINPKTIRVSYEDTKSPAYRIAKRMPGFVQHDGYATIPFSKLACYILLNNGFDMGKHIWRLLDKKEKIRTNNLALDKLPRFLYPYQKEGVAFVLSRGGNAILAHDCGLGKTMQAIAYGKLAGWKRLCIVCPASLKENWKIEIEKWAGETDVAILSGKKPDASLINAKWIIINYDILADWGALLEDAEIEAWIFDEAQALKNSSSIRYRAAEILTEHTPTLLLSGTPIENRPSEFFPIIKLVQPKLFPNKLKFYERYCDLKRNGMGMLDATGASNTKELHKILTDTIMHRLKKVDVLDDLPEKRRVVIPVALSSRDMQECAKIEEDFASWLAGKTGELKHDVKVEAMAKLEALKQIIAVSKLPMVYNWIDTYLEAEDKLVVFAHHKAVIAELKKHYARKCVVIDGSVATSKRQELVDKFQNDKKIKLFIGNIKAAGTGITLTAAHDTLTVELVWTSTAHDQCESRTHRLGQRNAVTAYYLIAKNTIEERLAKAIDDKRGILQQVMDGEEVENMDLLDTLLKEYREEA